MTPSRSRGLALIAVLWGLVLLSVIAVSVVTTTRTEAVLAHNLAQNAIARALAEAGIERAVLALLEPGLGESAAADLEAGAVPAMPAGGGLREDGTVYAWPVRGGQVLISVQDEGGRIDLNRAPDEILRGLFAAVGLDRDQGAALTDAIVDYRDTNSARRLNGAEDRDYRAAGRAYGAKDRPFEASDELRQVLGMTPELYAQVAPALTVYSRRRRINPATAPPLALAASAGVAGEPPPRQSERSVAGEAFVRLGAVAGGQPRSRIGIYRIRAEARTEAGAVFVREAVISLKGDPGRLYRVLEWKRGKLVEPGDGSD